MSVLPRRGAGAGPPWVAGRRGLPPLGRRGPSGGLLLHLRLRRRHREPGAGQDRSSGPGLGRILALVLLASLVVTGAGLLVGGGAAFALLARMEAELPDVQRFETLAFSQPTRVYARDGKHWLATFFTEKRTVVAYADLPHLVMDATTSVEDRTFWDNEGVDLMATLSALAGDVSGASDRGGGSTITQQLVRARLLPKDLVGDPDRLYERKAKEIIQSYRLTQAYPGEDGKRRILTAYLNQIPYGHHAYGIVAAAQVYFGETLDELSPAQAALLAGLPQSPSVLDPYRYAKTTTVTGKDGRKRKALVVPTCGSAPPAGCQDAAPVVRRNFILRALADGHGRWTRLTPAQLKTALDEPIVLRGDTPMRWNAPQFVWLMREELDRILADREPAETGGYRVITTLDWKAQTIATRYVRAAAQFTQYGLARYYRALREARIPRADRSWLRFLRGKHIENAALLATDYRTGDVLAYVGSADYYGRDTRRMDPKFDVIRGFRQPGSAWKPIVYASAIDSKAITAGSVILDVTTPFAPGWDPKNADLRERGPVLARKALQYSLNIPAIRVLDRVGARAVGQYAARAGISFLTGRKGMVIAGLAGAIGTVETRMLDLVPAYGAFGNGGLVATPRTILRVEDANGREIHRAPATPATRRFVSPQTAFVMADILAGNTNPRVNIYWGPRFRLDNGPRGAYRPAGLKTGTTNDIRDLSAYGLVAPPRDRRAPAVAVGVWMGNSDHSRPTLGGNPLFASDGPAQVWRSFLRDYLRGKPVAAFKPPARGLVRGTIDAYSGGRPGPWTRDTVQEWFLAGTEPGARRAIDPPGLAYRETCGRWMIDPLKAENRGAPASWRSAVRDWMDRARRGSGVRSSRFGTTTVFLEGRSSWGGAIAPTGPCPTPRPQPTAAPVTGRGTGGADRPRPTVRPAPRPRPTPRPRGQDQVRPKPQPKPKPTPRPRGEQQSRPKPQPKPKPKPKPKPQPRPKPTPRPQG